MIIDPFIAGQQMRLDGEWHHERDTVIIFESGAHSRDAVIASCLRRSSGASAYFVREVFFDRVAMGSQWLHASPHLLAAIRQFDTYAIACYATFDHDDVMSASTADFRRVLAADVETNGVGDYRFVGATYETVRSDEIIETFGCLPWSFTKRLSSDAVLERLPHARAIAHELRGEHPAAEEALLMRDVAP